MVIPPPHGGRLIRRDLKGPARDRRLSELPELPLVHPIIDQVYDLQQIAYGSYSPLEGPLGSSELESVLERRRLPSGTIWPMPILLTLASRGDLEAVWGLKAGDMVAVADMDGRPYATVELTELYDLDVGHVAERTYGTRDPQHPNVSDLMSAGSRALAGKVDLVQPLNLPAAAHERTPEQTREEFHRQGWKAVVAYQCRNPPHTAHEYLQRVSLEREDVDGLFIQPVVGKLKPGDYRPEVILEAYDRLVHNYYPPNRVLLGSLSISMRYAGPIAALFFAIVRKNFGCSHYIVGRDQAGVGKYYDPYACHRIFDEFPVDGVTPLRYHETFYCRACQGMASSKICPHPASEHQSTSQTLIRQKLRNGEKLPHEILRPEVAEVLARGDVLSQL
jgi:sulfate adenylyltransferase